MKKKNNQIIQQIEQEVQDNYQPSDIMQLNYNIFGQTDLSNLYKQIYNNSKQMKTQLMSIIANVSGLINSAVDVQFIGGTLASLINASINNDGHLISLANSVNKMIIAGKKSIQGSDSYSLIDEAQLQQLQKKAQIQIQSMDKTVKSLNQINKRKSKILDQLNVQNKND